MSIDVEEAIPLTSAPFTRAEYQRRHEAVVARLPDAGIDAIAATAHSHQQYLGGYDGAGDYFAPFPLVLAPGRPATYVVRRYDEDSVRAQSVIDEIVTYSQERDFARAVADVLRGMGLEHGRLGLELGAWHISPNDVAAIRAELPDLRIVDATRLVASVAAVKSPVELDVMRRAMAFTRIAIDTFHAGIVEGASEIDVAHAIEAAVERANGSVGEGYTLLFGARTALPHGTPGLFRLERDQPAFTEISGWLHGYAAGLCRTAILGRHADAEALHAIAQEALEAAIDTIRPGATAGDVDRACRAVVERAGRSASFRHRTGYQIGIMWADRGNLSLEPDALDVLEAGMTLHLPIILFEQGRFGVGVSETVLVTDTGAEVLSGLPSTFHRAT